MRPRDTAGLLAVRFVTTGAGVEGLEDEVPRVVSFGAEAFRHWRISELLGAPSLAPKMAIDYSPLLVMAAGTRGVVVPAAIMT